MVSNRQINLRGDAACTAPLTPPPSCTPLPHHQPISHVSSVNTLGIVQTLPRITFMTPAALLDFSVDETQLVASSRTQPCFLLTKQQNPSVNKEKMTQIPCQTFYAATLLLFSELLSFLNALNYRCVLRACQTPKWFLVCLTARRTQTSQPTSATSALDHSALTVNRVVQRL